MSEWWTYSLSDFLLFSPRTYYRLFELYNAAIWPLQLVGFALGAAILGLLLRDVAWRGRAIATALAVCWLWVAWAYFLKRYETINWAASYFAVGFAVEALLLIWSGIVRDRLRFPPAPSLTLPRLRGREGRGSLAGLCILLFALLVHPVVGPLVGRPWPQVELFGVAPDPTVVATLGVLAAAHRPHWELLVIPLVWCAISGATLWTMQSPDALVMPVVAALALVLAVWKTLQPRLA
jgi:Family of unknown function (DUF6064)